MKLWHLEAGDGPAWKPWYDKAFSFVIRAETEQAARQLADANAGDENDDDNHPWLDAEQSSCAELTEDGPGGVIERNFASA